MSYMSVWELAWVERLEGRKEAKGQEKVSQRKGLRYTEELTRTADRYKAAKCQSCV